MVIIVVGKDEKNIDKAVKDLIRLEKGKEVVEFKDIEIPKGRVKEPPDINNSIILLDFPDTLPRNSETKRAILMTWMMMQARPRQNIFIGKVLHEKPNLWLEKISKRVNYANNIVVTAEPEEMKLFDRMTGGEAILKYGQEVKLSNER